MEFQSERGRVLETHVRRLIEARQFSGVTWCVEHQGRVVAQGADGHRDAQALQAMSEDTLFRLYSMTKPIVSVYCLQLIESGLLQLDDPVSRYIPEFGQQQVLASDGRLQALQRAMTIEDLLTHRSGLSYDFLPGCKVAEGYRDAGFAADGGRSLQELCVALAEMPLAHQPGSCWYYSYSTDVLAGVLERVSDKPLGTCLQESLFAPLGMEETAFQVGAENRSRLAQMFGQRELGQVPVAGATDRAPVNRLQPMDVEQSYPSDSETFTRGGIGLYSSMRDYRRFMGVLMHGKTPDGARLLSRPMLDLAWQNRLRDSQMPITIGDKAYPGYGWGLTGRLMVDTSAALRLSACGEGGWAGAASTWFWVDPAREFSGIVMTQYLGSEISLGPDMQGLAYAALG
ncbi:serine hydrolase domain-containing protein [Granulosicoccus sp. 3-233]|uniref:serine hydrolase domain-containing protein n=1 Tax=Granulosicoccus sp. 3-233 TaxID=3417969 RepID=UPI003D325325